MEFHVFYFLESLIINPQANDVIEESHPNQRMPKGRDHNWNDTMQGLRLGREDAFDRIFVELYGTLCLFAANITGHQSVAEDIVGEAFIKIWERKTDFIHFLSLRAFLYTTVRNASLDWLRKTQARDKRLRAALPIFEQPEKTSLEQLITAETYRELYSAISTLPAQCRDVIHLSYLERKSLREVAVTLNIAVGTVKSQKSRGLVLLKKKLKYFLYFFF